MHLSPNGTSTRRCACCRDVLLRRTQRAVATNTICVRTAASGSQRRREGAPPGSPGRGGCSNLQSLKGQKPRIHLRQIVSRALSVASVSVATTSGLSSGIDPVQCTVIVLRPDPEEVEVDGGSAAEEVAATLPPRMTRRERRTGRTRGRDTPSFTRAQGRAVSHPRQRCPSCRQLPRHAKVPAGARAARARDRGAVFFPREAGRQTSHEEATHRQRMHAAAPNAC